MNMEMSQKETDLATITTSSLLEREDMLNAPVKVEMNEQEAATVIQVLRLTNSKILKRAMQLEKTRAESQKDLQFHHQERSLLQTQLAQKTQELEAAQEQIKLLKQEQQALKEKTTQQQILNEGLTVQLQTSQERVNQLEHEWILTQAIHNKQIYQLQQSESTCQELRNRLTRQQHYTTQLKVALEKCLDKPNSKSEVESDRIFTYTNSESPQQVTLAQEQPIPPWSNQDLAIDGEVFPTTQPLETVFETNVDEIVDAVIEPCSEAIAPLEQSPDWLEATLTEAAETQCNDPESASISSKSTTEDEAPIWDEPEFLANPNWPSPILNPARTKKRKSLAAIELPTFAHSR